MTATAAAIKAHSILATLDLSDPDELRAHDWIERFFAKGGTHKLADLARARHPAQHPDLIMLGEHRPQREGAETEWAVFRYRIKAISVSWLCYATLDEASAAFGAAVAVPSWPQLLTASPAP